VGCIHLGNTSDYIVAYMGVGTNNDALGASWIREGIFSGAGGTATWYWEDKRPGHSEFIHFRPDLGSPLNTDIGEGIHYDGVVNGVETWSVFRDGSFVSYSKPNAGPSRYLEAGVVTNSDVDHLESDAHDIQRTDSNGVQHDWSSANYGHAVITTTGSGASASWFTQYSDLLYSYGSC
jgi:hypothetical protein